MWVYFWVLYSVPFIYVFIPLPISHNLDHCSYIMSLEIVYRDLCVDLVSCNPVKLTY